MGTVLAVGCIPSFFSTQPFHSLGQAFAQCDGLTVARLFPWYPASIKEEVEASNALKAWMWNSQTLICLIPLGKASRKTGPDSRGEDIDPTFRWAVCHTCLWKEGVDGRSLSFGDLPCIIILLEQSLDRATPLFKTPLPSHCISLKAKLHYNGEALSNLYLY